MKCKNCDFELTEEEAEYKYCINCGNLLSSMLENSIKQIEKLTQEQKKQALLIVDPNPSEAYKTEKILKNRNYKTIVCTDTGGFNTYYHHVLNILNNNNEIALVLLETAKQNNKYGWLILKKIKSKGRYKRILVVPCTHQFQPRFQMKAKKLGADGYIAKPIPIEQFLIKIEQILKAEPRQDFLKERKQITIAKIIIISAIIVIASIMLDILI